MMLEKEPFFISNNCFDDLNELESRKFLRKLSVNSLPFLLPFFYIIVHDELD